MARPTTELTWHLCRNIDCGFTAFYDWQTLIGSVLAVGGAYYAGRLVLKQIRQADEQEASRRRRRFVAARSTLPLTLSSIAGFARGMTDRLKIYRGHRVNENLDGLLFVMEPPPADAIAAIERMIEATDDVQITKLLRQIVSEIQTLLARCEEMTRPREHLRMGIAADINGYILQCAVLYAQTVDLFDFARFEAEDVPPMTQWASVYSALNLLGVREEGYPQVWQQARSRERASLPPQ